MSTLRLRDVARRHGPAYLARFGDSVLPSHRAALQAICDCRTPKLGGHVTQCVQCGTEHEHFHSCRNRACPRCGQDAAERWLARQHDLLLPVPYFHVVFTLPSELRMLVRTHQRALLGALFHAAFESLTELCADPRLFGATQLGALAVLHTWTRTLEWHPHIHMLVPGGGLAADGSTWVTPRTPRARRKGSLSPKSPPFLVPVKALSRVFRRHFARLAREAVPGIALPEAVFHKRWVTFAKPIVQGPEKVLEYLGRYVYRTALSDSALVDMDDTHVTFRYRRSDDGTRRQMRLPAHEFLRRFLQHVLPRGFHRVRTFGLLHAARRTTLRRLQLLLSPRTPATAAATPATAAATPAPPAARRCRDCQGQVVIVRLLTRAECHARLTAAASPRGPPEAASP